MPLKPQLADESTPRSSMRELMPEREPDCFTYHDHHRTLLLTQADGSTQGFPLTWLYHWQWKEHTTHETLTLTLTEHVVTVQGKHLDHIIEHLSKGTGLHLRIKDARYQSQLRPHETLIATISVQPHTHEA